LAEVGVLDNVMQWNTLLAPLLMMSLVKCPELLISIQFRALFSLRSEVGVGFYRFLVSESLIDLEMGMKFSDMN
jgi:hypothetical protein